MVHRVRPLENARSLPFPLDNDEIADRLIEVSELLEAKEANPYRVRAYRNAANTVRSYEGSLADLVRSGGAESLTELPGVGDSIAGLIEQLCLSGETSLLKRLQGRLGNETVLTTVAGVGPKTAAMIHEKLGIETLEDLEVAAYDGRLNALPGMGHKRLRSVRESLAGRFQRYPRPAAAAASKMPQPEIGLLLSIDTEYRRKAMLGRLVQISPSRFNPDRKLWLPILRTRRDGHQYTAIYSNSPLAHELGTTRDWVVISCKGDDRLWTVVTDHRESAIGRRVVRGREIECDAYYARMAESH